MLDESEFDEFLSKAQAALVTPKTLFHESGRHLQQHRDTPPEAEPLAQSAPPALRYDTSSPIEAARLLSELHVAQRKMEAALDKVAEQEWALQLKDEEIRQLQATPQFNQKEVAQLKQELGLVRMELELALTEACEEETESYAETPRGQLQILHKARVEAEAEAASLRKMISLGRSPQPSQGRDSDGLDKARHQMEAERAKRLAAEADLEAARVACGQKDASLSELLQKLSTETTLRHQLETKLAESTPSRERAESDGQLADKLLAVSLERDRLVRKVERHQAERQRAAAEVQLLRQTNEMLKRQVRGLEEGLREMQAKSALADEHAAKQATHDSELETMLRQRVASLEQELEDAEGRLSSTVDKASQHRAQQTEVIETLMERVGSLEEALGAARARDTEGREEAAATIKQQGEMMSMLRGRVESMEQALEVAQTENTRLVAESQQKVASSQSKQASLEQALVGLEQALAQSDEERATSIEQAAAEQARRDEELAELQNKHRLLEESLAQSEMNHVRVSSGARQTQDKLEQTISELRARIEPLERALELTEAECARIESEAQHRRVDQLELVASTNKKHATLEERVKAKEAECMRLTLDNEQRRQREERLRAKEEATEQALAIAERDRLKEAASNRETLVVAQNKIITLEQALSKATAESTHLSDQLTKSRTELVTLETASAANTQLKKDKEEICRTVDTERQRRLQLEQQVSELEAKLEGAETRRRLEQKQATDAISRLKAEQTTLESRLRPLAAALLKGTETAASDTMDVVNALSQAVAHARKERVDAVDTMETLQRKMREQESQLASSRNHQDALASQLEDALALAAVVTSPARTGGRDEGALVEAQAQLEQAQKISRDSLEIIQQQSERIRQLNNRVRELEASGSPLSAQTVRPVSVEESTATPNEAVPSRSRPVRDTRTTFRV